VYNAYNGLFAASQRAVDAGFFGKLLKTPILMHMAIPGNGYFFERHGLYYYRYFGSKNPKSKLDLIPSSKAFKK
jgi:hypothetical protein